MNARRYLLVLTASEQGTFYFYGYLPERVGESLSFKISKADFIIAT